MPVETASRLFVSRESQLATLAGVLRRRNGAVCLVYGSPGVGKTALLQRLYEMGEGMPKPDLWIFPPDWGKCESGKGLVACLSDHLRTHWPSLIPYIDAFSLVAEAGADSEGNDEWQRFCARIVEYFFQPEGMEDHPELADLSIVSVLEDVDSLKEPVLKNIQRLKMAFRNDPMLENRITWIVSAKDKARAHVHLELAGFTPGSVEEIGLGPFSLSESSVLLGAWGVDAAAFEKIHKDCAGIPQRLVEACGRFARIPPDEAEKIRLAEDLLKRFGGEQREWLKIAAILGACDPEALSLFLSKDQRELAFRWLSGRPVSGIVLENGIPVMAGEERAAILAWQRKEDPGLEGKRSRKLESLLSVRKSIPKLEHRKALAYLSELETFSIQLLESLTDAERVKFYQSLLDSKTIYFQFRDGMIRLAGNIRVILRLYNQLIPFEGRQVLREKAQLLWKKRSEELQQPLLELEERIRSQESSREDAMSLLGQIERTKRDARQGLQKAEKNSRVFQQEVRNIRGNWIAPTLQVFGIAGLYAGILLKEDITWPILLAGIVLVTIGFLHSMKNQTFVRRRKKAIRTNSAEKRRLEKQVERLDSESAALASRRDNATRQILECHEEIKVTERLLRQPYVR
jgi:hypothetical protein